MKAVIGECYLLNSRGSGEDGWGFAFEMLPLNRDVVIIKETNLPRDEYWEPHFYLFKTHERYSDTWGFDPKDVIKLIKRG